MKLTEDNVVQLRNGEVLVYNKVREQIENKEMKVDIIEYEGYKHQLNKRFDIVEVREHATTRLSALYDFKKYRLIFKELDLLEKAELQVAMAAGFSYIAREKSGMLCYYPCKPDTIVENGVKMFEAHPMHRSFLRNMFDFVTHENSPIDIEELLLK